MAAKSASPGAQYDRAAAHIYGGRDTGTDGLSSDPARIRQAARFRPSRPHKRRHPKGGSPAMKNGAFLLLVALLAGLSAGCKSKGRASIAADPLRQAYDSEADWS